LKVRPSLAPELDHVVGQAMSKRPADRYQTMEELREDLTAVAEGLKPLKAKARPAAIKLAVLPFANLTGDPDQEFLSDGLTQEMIAQLGRLHPQSLSVIARTSVMRYKKTDTPIDQIGRELGVDYVLEGSAQREGAGYASSPSSFRSGIRSSSGRTSSNGRCRAFSACKMRSQRR